MPTSALQGKIPYEAWTGRKPSLRHLRLFGSRAYAHVPEAKKNSKFEARAEKMLLVGYMDELQAYKLLHPQTHKAVYSRSVVVHEEAILNLGLHLQNNATAMSAPPFADMQV